MAEINLNIDSSFFNEVYIPYLNKNERWQVFYGGYGSGKSNFVATNLVLGLLKQKCTLLVVRQTFATHRDSTFAELKSAIERMGIMETVKISKTTLEIEFHNGSKIIFKGADDEQKLLSIFGINLCWIEEATEISKEILDQLNLRLRGGRFKKHIFLIFNPVSN